MAGIFDIQARVKQIDIRGIASDIISSDENELVKANQDQMQLGKDADGKEITPSYWSDAYADMKHSMNPKAGYGVPDLKLTGAFYRGMFYDSSINKMSSMDAKTPSLLEKYGNVLGLNKDAINKYRSIFRPKFTTEIKVIMSGN